MNERFIAYRWTAKAGREVADRAAFKLFRN